MSGLDPYHSRYNPKSLDGLDTENLNYYDTKDCILSVPTHIIADAQYHLKQVNDAWKELTGKNETYEDLTGFLENYIKSQGAELEDVKDRMIEEQKETYKEEGE
jgi:hypothetical protein